MLRVLLVDDGPEQATLVARALQRTGIDITLDTAATGVAAFDYLSSRASTNEGELPDVVLLDLGLPDIDGHDVLATLKLIRELQHIPVVILSGSQDPEDIDRGRNLRASSYIVKPLSIDELAGSLAKVLTPNVEAK